MTPQNWPSFFAMSLSRGNHSVEVLWPFKDVASFCSVNLADISASLKLDGKTQKVIRLFWFVSQKSRAEKEQPNVEVPEKCTTL